MKTYKAKSICTDFKPTNYTSGNLVDSAKLIYTVPNNCIARLVSGMSLSGEGSNNAASTSPITLKSYIKVNNSTTGWINSSGAWIIGYHGDGSDTEPQPTTGPAFAEKVGTATNPVKTFVDCPAYLNAGDKVYAIVNAYRPGTGDTLNHLINAGAIVLNFIEEYDA